VTDIRRYDTLDSTNEEARRLAAAGEKAPLWIIAREQTNGRGRHGRVWISQAGNLFATFLTQAPQAKSGQLAFAAALAVYETVAHFAPSIPLTLKWPNDVLLNGKKVAGILLEGLAVEGLAIGIGINLAHCPDVTEFPATSVASEMGYPADPEEALAVLAEAMSSWYEVWARHGFAKLREAWLARASHLGKEIRARLDGSEFTGVFEGLDEDGALRLRIAGGAIQRISAGDVFF
jgi:BirA family biotin operon repressor/biotin-[acetyl-CoA-carboxylase] ligase